MQRNEKRKAEDDSPLENSELIQHLSKKVTQEFSYDFKIDVGILLPGNIPKVFPINFYVFIEPSKNKIIAEINSVQVLNLVFGNFSFLNKNKKLFNLNSDDLIISFSNSFITIFISSDYKLEKDKLMTFFLTLCNENKFEENKITLLSGLLADMKLPQVVPMQQMNNEYLQQNVEAETQYFPEIIDEKGEANVDVFPNLDNFYDIDVIRNQIEQHFISNEYNLFSILNVDPNYLKKTYFYLIKGYNQKEYNFYCKISSFHNRYVSFEFVKMDELDRSEFLKNCNKVKGIMIGMPHFSLSFYSDRFVVQSKKITNENEGVLLYFAEQLFGNNPDQQLDAINQLTTIYDERFFKCTNNDYSQNLVFMIQRLGNKVVFQFEKDAREKMTDQLVYEHTALVAKLPKRAQAFSVVCNMTFTKLSDSFLISFEDKLLLNDQQLIKLANLLIEDQSRFTFNYTNEIAKTYFGLADPVNDFMKFFKSTEGVDPNTTEMQQKTSNLLNSWIQNRDKK